MCMPKMPKPAQPIQVAAYDNTEALQQGDQEAALRRRRRGAAANILTGPGGIPSTATMGGKV